MAKPQPKKKWRIRDELIFDTIMQMVNVDAEKAVRPQDIAIMIQPDDWQNLLKRVRLFARQLAHDGYVHIMRKGKIADPDDFRGVYRIQATDDAANYIPRMPTS